MSIQLAVGRAHIFRVLEQSVMIGLRAANVAAKFVLAIYMTRYLGLADLGAYGLMVGAATSVPAIFGFGLNDWIGRHVVQLRTADAFPLMTMRLTLTVAVQFIGQSLAWTANFLAGALIPWVLAIPIGLVLFFEHLASDAYVLLLARERSLFANVLLFMRAGLWAIVAIAWGIADPGARSFENILYCWVGGLIASWIVLLAVLARTGRWRLVRLSWSRLGDGLRGGVPFYLSDIAAVGNLYLDRFLISMFLGLEQTGIYTFFWSVANVVHLLAAYGIVQPQLAKLVRAAGERDAEKFYRMQRRLQFDALIWATVIAVVLGVLVPLLLPYLHRPELDSHLSILAVVMIATLPRVGADGYRLAMYALNREHAIAVVAIAALAISAALNAALVPLAGLTGAATAYLLVAAGLMGANYWLSRPAAA